MRQTDRQKGKESEQSAPICQWFIQIMRSHWQKHISEATNRWHQLLAFIVNVVAFKTNRTENETEHKTILSCRYISVGGVGAGAGFNSAALHHHHRYSEKWTYNVLQALSHHRIKTESNRFKFDSYDGWLRSIANSRKSEIRFFFCFVPLSVVSQMEWMTRILLIFYYTAEWVVSMVYKFIWEMSADRVTLSTGGVLIGSRKNPLYSKIWHAFFFEWFCFCSSYGVRSFLFVSFFFRNFILFRCKDWNLLHGTA